MKFEYEVDVRGLVKYLKNRWLIIVSFVFLSLVVGVCYYRFNIESEVIEETNEIVREDTYDFVDTKDKLSEAAILILDAELNLYYCDDDEIQITEIELLLNTFSSTNEREYIYSLIATIDEYKKEYDCNSIYDLMNELEVGNIYELENYMYHELELVVISDAENQLSLYSVLVFAILAGCFLVTGVLSIYYFGSPYVKNAVDIKNILMTIDYREIVSMNEEMGEIRIINLLNKKNKSNVIIYSAEKMVIEEADSKILDGLKAELEKNNLEITIITDGILNNVTDVLQRADGVVYVEKYWEARKRDLLLAKQMFDEMGIDCLGVITL